MQIWWDWNLLYNCQQRGYARWILRWCHKHGRYQIHSWGYDYWQSHLYGKLDDCSHGQARDTSDWFPGLVNYYIRLLLKQFSYLVSHRRQRPCYVDDLQHVNHTDLDKNLVLFLQRFGFWHYCKLWSFRAWNSPSMRNFLHLHSNQQRSNYSSHFC